MKRSESRTIRRRVYSRIEAGASGAVAIRQKEGRSYVARGARVARPFSASLTEIFVRPVGARALAINQRRLLPTTLLINKRHARSTMQLFVLIEITFSYLRRHACFSYLAFYALSY